MEPLLQLVTQAPAAVSTQAREGLPAALGSLSSSHKVAGGYTFATC